MPRRIIIEPAALLDLDAHFAYFAQDNIDVALRYLHSWWQAFDQLADWPGIGSRRDYGHPELQDMRVWSVPHFPNYLIFYRADEVQLQVLRVLHGAQNIDAIFDVQ